MKLSFAHVLPALTALTSASPIERETYPIHAPRHIFTRQDVQTSINASLPNVTIFATGGTIASQGSSNTQTVGYSIGLGVQNLIDAVPDDGAMEIHDLNERIVDMLGDRFVGYLRLKYRELGFLERTVLAHMSLASRLHSNFWSHVT